MGTSILAINSASVSPQLFQRKALIPQDMKVNLPTDAFDIGKGETPSADQSMQIVVERAMDKLRSVVSDARAALGLSEDDQIDTSAEATANRIADFALGAFDRWSKNHTGLADDDARKQFADFIGGAIQQGIAEARGILTSLNALSTDVSNNIDNTWAIIQKRLDDFVANGK
jgi:hypothetical protein